VMLPHPWDHTITAGIAVLHGKAWVVVKQVCDAALYPAQVMATKPERLMERLVSRQAPVERLDKENHPELLYQLRVAGLLGKTTPRANIVHLDDLCAALLSMGKARDAVNHLLQGYASLLVTGSPADAAQQVPDAATAVPPPAAAVAQGSGQHRHPSGTAQQSQPTDGTGLRQLPPREQRQPLASGQQPQGPDNPTSLQQHLADALAAAAAAAAAASSSRQRPVATGAGAGPGAGNATSSPHVVVNVSSDINTMPFPSAWPRTLPVAKYTEQQLHAAYSLASIVPHWQSLNMPLAEELPQLQQWCQAGVDTSRPTAYKAVRDVTYDKTEEVALGFMGFCFKHRGIPSPSISLSLANDPQHLAAFASFLMARQVNDNTMRSVSGQVNKLLRWLESSSQVSHLVEPHATNSLHVFVDERCRYGCQQHRRQGQ